MAGRPLRLFLVLFLVVVDDFDLICVSRLESKADSPLLVDPNAPIALPILMQRFQAIRLWKPQVVLLSSQPDSSPREPPPQAGRITSNDQLETLEFCRRLVEGEHFLGAVGQGHLRNECVAEIRTRRLPGAQGFPCKLRGFDDHLL